MIPTVTDLEHYEMKIK